MYMSFIKINTVSKNIKCFVFNINVLKYCKSETLKCFILVVYIHEIRINF